MLKPEGPDTVYYLNSILRQLRDWQEIATTSESFYGPTIATEVLADNIDWLDCHIDSLKPHEEEKAKVIAWANRAVDSVKNRMWDLEDALKGIFARLDHPDNGGQFVSYFLRWPEVEAARKALSGAERIAPAETTAITNEQTK